ncbi:carboxyl transferase domain-containing protein [Virgisporangium ochraceum]|uniref:Fused acetyl/propionyl-CoA carboxylase subuit alpha/methylmalonyl-CoA decarboxylase subunit alpha n=1 Tax=Virgisporangium ochraceum TaxID=65505 RepID=A0A8J4EE24_9ACTN|nr:carboxyl transferase domain-containing protein [Virgisporangium ochraceum]GIJ71276.1 fused acetyl/propionyl-CoA carboxylase subuit alpha/methylmalonyl-CoA decarboxylase subunit alpha [Virgisporangium ochraceum]
MVRRMERLAIVSRGGAATRALTAVRELNASGDGPPVTTVVPYTDADADAWFVREADEAVPLGPATSVALADEVAVTDALVAAGVDAVWAGWGALAVRDTFVERCERAGILFVGPGSATVRLLADEAVAAARWAGVPVEPWSDGPAPHHAEIQVVADEGGTVWALGPRGSTVRRHHRTVVVESGSTAVDAGTARALRDAAVRLAREVDYRGVATVEFLVGPGTGRFRFLRMRGHLPAEHPVTELTTGLDLVKLQFHLARGGRLADRPPPVTGYAVMARLCAEDPENGFVATPGRLTRLTLPTGIGVRVDQGVREGEVVRPDADPTIATIAAWGGDRPEALARLRRALGQTTVVVQDGWSNRTFLLSALGRPEVVDGTGDVHWLTDSGAHLPGPDPMAVLAAAVSSYEQDRAAEQAAFHALAGRGVPPSGGGTGHRCLLRYRGERYDLHVYRTGAHGYRVTRGGRVADVTVARRGDRESRFTVGQRSAEVVTIVDGATIRVEVDDAGHTVRRVDGGVVRSTGPAFVASLLVGPGDPVTAGQPLAVLESMKMESTVTAPFAGTVVSVETAAHSQVEAGAPLVRIRAQAVADGPGGAAPAFPDLPAAPEPGTPPCERVYRTLRGYLLGYDLDPAALRATLTRQRRLGEAAPPADPGLLHCEDGLLDLFTDVGALYRARGATGPQTASTAQAYLLSYLQWLDADRAGLPAEYRHRLERALLRYGVTGLGRTPELEEAVVWMFRSFRRAAELAPVVAGILERRLRHRAALAAAADDANRARLDRLATIAHGRYGTVADLARDVRFHYFDEPLLAAVVADEYTRVGEALDALSAHPDRADGPLMDRLVGSPQPLREVLLRRWRTATEPAVRALLLEVYTRRFYRVTDLSGPRVTVVDGWPVCQASYDLDDEHVHLVAAYAPLDDLPRLYRAVAAHLAGSASGGPAVIDVQTWRHGDADADTVVAEVEKAVRDCDPATPVSRLDVTVTNTDGSAPEAHRTYHLSYRRHDGGFVEDPLYRNLHPMLARRLDLGRMAGFRLRRLRSAEDVYLFDGAGHDDPLDHRLFALAEVRDVTPTDDAGSDPRYPRVELMGLLALSAMREALAGYADADRPVANRLELFVRPPWDPTPAVLTGLARSLAPLASGAHLAEVVLHTRRPDGTATAWHVEGSGTGVTVQERPPDRDPVRPLSRYDRKLLKARRVGAPYPYEIVRMLTPPAGAVTRFPPGRFTEYDLDAHDDLVPVSRPPGLNTANVVVGVLSNDTDKVPEGMARVCLLGDPTRGLGNLAEPECRRIIAALDLAGRMRVPLEWFAVSSGARIAMDSGTENMDWIAAVLRRLIEFTQAGGEVNIVVTGVNVGAQPYWNAEATMLMHTRGILVMTPASAMVLTGKQALDFSGGVSAEDNFGIGGYDRVMGPNGQAQYWAATLPDACGILLRHYEHTYVVPGEVRPRRRHTGDPVDRDVCDAPHADASLRLVGDVFSATVNPDRKRPFDMRSVMRAVTDSDADPLERWTHWRDAEVAIVWDAHIGGIPVCLLGTESRTTFRRGFVPADGPPSWTAGTLFPQASRKIARAVNAASGNRPLVVLANLSGFDGSPESMGRWQLEYGAEIGRAVTNFRGPIVFVVVSRYHGGAFVVFSKALNPRMEVAAVAGSFASVIGGPPAAATVFAREVRTRTEADPRVRAAASALADSPPAAAGSARTHLAGVRAAVRAAKLGEVAGEFDRIHTVTRALETGSVDRIIPAGQLRPYIVDALERGLAADGPVPADRSG